LALFDEEINRCGVPALKVHPMVVGADGENLFAAGVTVVNLGDAIRSSS